MAALLVECPKRSTRKKAKGWLEGSGVAFEERGVAVQRLTAAEPRACHEADRAAALAEADGGRAARAIERGRGA